MDNYRVPPQNLDAERAVLGSILIDSSVLIRIVEILKPEHFYDLRNATLYEFILKLYGKAKPVDVVTLGAELSSKSKVKQAGGTNYLSEIISSVPTSANAEHYAEIVRDAAVRRSLITFGGKLDQTAREENKELDEILDELEKNIFSISNDTSTSDFFDAATLLDMQMKRADEFAKNPTGIRGLPTGLTAVDKMLGGLQKSDLIILAARPSVGKSAFIFDVSRNIAVNEKKSVAIFSLEMPAVQVIERMLAQQIQVPLWNLRMGRMTDDDYKKYAVGAGKISDSKIFIDDTPGINIMQLRSKARRLMLEHSLDLIVIDYLQLMQGNSRPGNDNRALEVGEISRSLKILARELQIPIVALSQLNRAVENRQDKIPQLSDLRESGSIEQDADLVIFLGRDLMTEDAEQSEPSFKVDVYIAKHRNGATGRFKLRFTGAIQKFTDFEE